MIPGVIEQEDARRGSAPTTIAGVRFNNVSSTVGLVKTAQVVTNSSLLTMSMFVRMTPYTGVAVATFNINVSDTNQLGPGFGAFDGATYNCIKGSGAGNYYLDSLGGIFPTGVWHHVFLSCDMNHAAGAKICNLWVDASAVGVNVKTDNDAAFSFPFSGENFGLPNVIANLGPSNYGTNIDYQSVWIAMGQYVAPSNIHLFRDPTTGLPQDLGPTGAGPTGTAPTYYFQGNAAAFSTNKGSGAAVTLTGTLTDVT
jgi:hypothetical protein